VLLQEEMRVPLVRGLTFANPLPLFIPTIGGAAFYNAAWAWQSGFEDHIQSAGFGVYLGGGLFPAFRWDYAWLSDDFNHYSHHPRTVFWIGYNF